MSGLGLKWLKPGLWEWVVSHLFDATQIPPSLEMNTSWVSRPFGVTTQITGFLLPGGLLLAGHGAAPADAPASRRGKRRLELSLLKLSEREGAYVHMSSLRSHTGSWAGQKVGLELLAGTIWSMRLLASGPFSGRRDVEGLGCGFGHHRAAVADPRLGRLRAGRTPKVDGTRGAGESRLAAKPWSGCCLLFQRCNNRLLVKGVDTLVCTKSALPPVFFG